MRARTSRARSAPDRTVESGGTLDRVVEVELRSKLGQLVADVGAQIGRCGRDFLDQLRASIDQREHVVDIEAGQQVAFTPTLPGAELRRDERCRRCGTYLSTGFESDRHGAGDRLVVPGIGETEDVGIGRHDIQNELRISASPPTDDGLTHRLLKPSLAKPFAEPVVLHTARHLADHIDIFRRPRWRSAGLGNPEVNRGPADEDDLIEQRPEKRRRSLQLKRAHRPATTDRSRSIFERRSPATFRTRASPALRLSSRARISPSSGQFSTASGAEECSGSMACPRTRPRA